MLQATDLDEEGAVACEKHLLVFAQKSRKLPERKENRKSEKCHSVKWHDDDDGINDDDNDDDDDDEGETPSG